MAMEKNKSKKKKNEYNGENEIIIGVTTPKKNKARVNNKNTRVNNKKNTRQADKKIKNKKENDKNEKINKINKGRKKIRLIILLIILTSCIVYLLTTPLFTVLQINVSGAEKNPTETYINLCGIQTNETNIFAFSKNRVINNLKQNAYVDKVTISRKLPNTIEIKLKERVAEYQIEYLNQYIYMDKQGYILETNEEKLENIIIKGFKVQELKPGQRIENEDLSKLEIILKITNYCKYNNITEKISSIDVNDILNYTVNFEEEGKIAYLGDASNLSEKILWLKTILNKEKGHKGEIFINGDLSTNKVFFRESE